MRKDGITWILLTLALTAACTANDSTEPASGTDHPHHAEPDITPSAPATVEQLAVELGCELYADNTTADFRQASCRHPTDHYVLLTFTKDTGQRDWLTAAKPWGGTYLVGQRWVVVANDTTALEPLRTRIGGQIQLGERH